MNSLLLKWCLGDLPNEVFDLGEIGWLQNVAAITSIYSASSVGSVLSQCMCFCVCMWETH